jgi:threonine dehydrogenase-like Zn-dependent dehydrogenase
LEETAGLKMRALVFRGVRDVAVESVPEPVLQTATDAIVRVLRASVCGSDLHPYHGREVGLDPGTVMGHEFAGEVLAVGGDVHGLRPGDVVVSPFSTACGVCWACAAGLSARCTQGQLFGWVQNGVGLPGAQAEQVRVPLADSTLVRVPPGVPLDVALLLGDVLATGAYAARRADLAPGIACAVVGCGPVGLAAVLAARRLGAEPIWALDTIPERLALAARYGAVPVAATSGERDDVRVLVRDATGGRGVDAVLEAVGSPGAARLALDLVRPGGTLSMVGVHTETAFAFTPAEAYDRNVTLRIGRCPARTLMPDLAAWLPSHVHEVAALVTHRVPLAEAAAAYALFDAKRDGCIKVVLDPTLE